MNFDNNAWFTIYDPEYKDDQYMFHYTDIDNAIKILYNNCLGFSKLCDIDDTLASKPKLVLDNSFSSLDAKKIYTYISNLKFNQLKFLCFTNDYKKDKEKKAVNNHQLFGDYTGRGFSSPRMWSQYTNNCVCFVFKKDKLLKKIKTTLNSSLIFYDNITYINKFDSYLLPVDTTNELLNELNNKDIQNKKEFETYKFLIQNLDFVKYCFFSKLDDWYSENEYGFLAFGNEDYYINNIYSALSGVVVNEKITKENLEIMSYFCYDKCELKKIDFTCSGCVLSNIHNE